MTLTPAPTSSKNHWFSFDAKHYHPFGLYDNQNNLIIRSDVQMELTISINANENDKNAFKDSHTTPPVGLIKSSYWFQAIKPHTAGDSEPYSKSYRKTITPIFPLNSVGEDFDTFFFS
jgi:hypothetical protein